MKRHTAFLLTLTLVASFLPGLRAAAATRFSPFTLIYGNDVRGELAPCG
ncbi:MAG: hypothetical protein AB1413_00090 [Thermodesulfobacteriota bacterium]